MTDIEICNQALTYAGIKIISSFDDNTREAEICKLQYSISLLTLLQESEWSFAKQYKPTNLLAENVDLRYNNIIYNYEYQLPSDFLRMIKLISKMQYAILNNKLYTISSIDNIAYIAKPENYLLPAYFIQALVFKLAYIFTITIAVDQEKATMIYKLAEKALKDALRIDSKNISHSNPISDLHNSRFYKRN